MLLPRCGRLGQRGTIQAHFIDSGSFQQHGDPNAPFRGARGRPFLSSNTSVQAASPAVLQRIRTPGWRNTAAAVFEYVEQIIHASSPS